MTTKARKNVLIVDDSPEDAELIADLLDEIDEGAFLTTVNHDAAKAVHDIRYNDFDLVLVDYNMPGNDGLWLLSELQVECLTIPVIFLTGSGDERVAVQALKLGATDYVSKVDIDAKSLGESIDYSIERKREDLAFLARATRDALTGVMARFSFMETLEQTLVRSERSKKKFAILFIDLDKFKPINDQHGHQVGDRVLVEASRRMAGSLRRCDTLARMGGDEFVVILEDVNQLCSPTSVHIVANRLHEAITAEKYCIPELNLELGASIGVAVYPDSGESAEALLNAADEAMYECKNASHAPPFSFHQSCIEPANVDDISNAKA